MSRDVRREATSCFKLHLRVEDPYCCLPPNFGQTPYQWKLSSSFRNAVSKITIPNHLVLSKSIERNYFPRLQTVLVSLEHDGIHDLSSIMGRDWLATEQQEWKEQLRDIRQGSHDDAIVDAMKRAQHSNVVKRSGELLESQVGLCINVKIELYNLRLRERGVCMVSRDCNQASVRFGLLFAASHH